MIKARLLKLFAAPKLDLASLKHHPPKLDLTSLKHHSLNIIQASG